MNTTKMMVEFTRAENWSDQSINVSKRLSEEAATIIYEVTYVAESYYFGDLSVRTFDGKNISIEKILTDKFLEALSIDSDEATFLKGK